MPKFTVQQFEDALKQEKFFPAYLFFGAELHIARHGLHVMKEKLGISNMHDDLSYSAYSGVEASVEKVMGALKTFPFLGGKNLIVIRDAHKLSKEMQAHLVDYLQKPFEHSLLVLIAEKLDGRSKLFAALQKQSAVIECKALYANQVPSWIASQVRQQKRQISHEAARYLADLVGTDLSQIDQALERLFLFVGKRPLIELSDVEMAIAETSQRSVFELTNNIGEKKLSKSLSVLTTLLHQGEAPVMILGMVARHFRLLTKAKEVEGRMRQSADLARYLGVHPFFAKDYLAQAQHYSLEELKQAFHAFAWCDRELKTTRLTKDKPLEKLIISLCHKRPSVN
ncbi:MAG: DNA polymerase III subunit delta [Deltaproteobacteria bacterium CG_4_10_14_0_2_um_filter_43_8]|nr:MAG: DNA polymerase III subunit delta [Deltaproteobacteria bacterium CG11_big_fil_rev_8_21_14_0_20_42_23]PJA20624.1 MAG: DNA polymerase III subunit delta [Deltaproteobacteria bacterium CG_4_10_14_0_2_um_filter_43_8]PJC65220.1 MAG: DNA polymerase III subunit delta [Deltaproteobacteria bacterium CG_4_9_14_0_2_um_filter_42_21]